MRISVLISNNFYCLDNLFETPQGAISIINTNEPTCSRLFLDYFCVLILNHSQKENETITDNRLLTELNYYYIYCTL